MMTRDQLALDLRRKGHTFKSIARQCQFADQSGAYKAVRRELQRRAKDAISNEIPTVG
jgi:hypothetical protein